MQPPTDCHVWPAVWSLLPPSMLTDAVLGVTRAAMAEGDYSRLPILADALEEAGCERTDVLAHLRRPGPHEAGCWALHQIVLTDRPYRIPEIPIPPPVRPEPTNQLILGAPYPGIAGFSGPAGDAPSKAGRVVAYSLLVAVIAGYLLVIQLTQANKAGRQSDINVTRSSP